jgi:chorismate synthase
VAAGAVAEKWLKVRFGIDVVAFVSSVGNIEADRSKIDYASLNRETVDQNIVRCPDVEAAEKMIAVAAWFTN